MAEQTQTAAHEQLPDSFELTPETGQQLNDYLMANGFHPWGHGTGFDDAQSFFDKGIVTVYNDGVTVDHDNLQNFALPITATPDRAPDAEDIVNVDYMRDWPHKKYSPQPNVVIMAVPNGDLEIGVFARLVEQNLMDKYEGDVGFPAELIVGFLDAPSGIVTMNPGRDISPEVRAKYIDLVAARVAAQRARDRAHFLAESDYEKPPTPAPPPIDLDSPDEDIF